MVLLTVRRNLSADVIDDDDDDSWSSISNSRSDNTVVIKNRIR